MRGWTIVGVVTCCLVGTTAMVSAQIDCNNLRTSTGSVPAELFDACWIGPSPSAAPEAPTDLAYGPDAVNSFFVNMMLNTPDVLNNIAPFDTTDFTGGCEFAYSDFTTMYCADVANNWFRINTATGARTTIGVLNPIPPNSETVSGLAFDRDNHQMYMCTTNVGTSSLMRVSIVGSTTLVGTITNSPGIIACAMDPAGNLWGYDIVDDTFLAIDKTTGAGTVVGPLGFDANYGQGMDFDESDGTCYLFAFNNTAYQPELRICDTSTGASALVGPIGTTVPGVLSLISGAGVAAEPFHPLLFGIDEERNQFFGIHQFSGAAQYVSSSPFDYSYSGLAYDTWRMRMYVSDVWDGAWSLIAINPWTGDHTVIGPHVSTVNIWGLAFDPVHDILWGADGSNDCLAVINTSTGEATCHGPFGTAENINGLAYNNHTSTLYGLGATNLFTISTATGAATAVGPHGLTASPWVMGLEYDSASGILFASAGGDTTLYALNPATGTASPYGQHRLSALGGLASMTGPGEPCGIFCDGFNSGSAAAWVTFP